jgi:exosortase/archaeosortase family protein
VSTGIPPAKSSTLRVPVRFALTFGAIALALFTLYAFPFAEGSVVSRFMAEYLAAYARLVGFVLGLVEPNVSIEGNIVHAGTSLQIVRSCDAMEVNILLSAAILAYPGVLLRKLAAVASCLTAVAAMNVVRILSLYYALREYGDAFDFLHLELWPLVMVVTAAVAFLAISGFLQKRASDDPAAVHASH